MRIQVTDVFLRDGLQDEDRIVSVEDRIAIGEAIAAAGIGRLEVASFVNPARVPQMAGAEHVLAGLQQSTTAELTVLTLNGKGVARALEAGAKNIQIVTSASQAHSTANAGRGIDEAMASLAAEVVKYPGTNFFAGISTAFTCPFEGRIDKDHLLKIVRAFKDMGVRDIGLADTLGTTPPEEAMASAKYVMDAEPALTYYLHLHNAHGLALETVDAAIAAGITRFDAALGGFGGCPFAPGAHGNIATEELVRHLHSAGHETGIDEDRLAAAVALARGTLARSPRVPEPAAK
ncbi:hydroxymethylglutaryl-CoA lyase [Arthrobacter crystallopoietes BAB-32]|uniref:Hydroxymethylglutaryl-CoA lyase n=1 Tax=Arthrobacter crystallopoietes BAB-32 TaxID=1246476 RepID=N1V474_9MICC|nr:hydroxymethylglutaryl-CoA lyase [Arthrobacter crystallopoietes]EMY34862.1 hydroxymethylglutaryl-CoA lyase [Arthrobacter crystallopoietes BAB-32]